MFNIISNLFFSVGGWFHQLFFACFPSSYPHKKLQAHLHFGQPDPQFVSVIFHCAKNLLYLHPELQPTKLQEDPILHAISLHQPIHQFLLIAIGVNISIRSNVSTSLCIYFDLILMRCRYLSISSAIRLVKCCYQNTVAFCNSFINFIQQIINLIYGWTDFNRRIQ